MPINSCADEHPVQSVNCLFLSLLGNRAQPGRRAPPCAPPKRSRSETHRLTGKPLELTGAVAELLDVHPEFVQESQVQIRQPPGLIPDVAASLDPGMFVILARNAARRLIDGRQ